MEGVQSGPERIFENKIAVTAYMMLNFVFEGTVVLIFFQNVNKV